MAEERFIRPLSLEFILATIIALINFALDQADIHILLISWLSIAACIMLLIDALRRTEWATRVGKNSIRFAAACIGIMVLFSGLGVYLVIHKRADLAKDHNPGSNETRTAFPQFKVERHVELVYSGHGDVTPYMYAQFSPNGEVSSVYHLLYLEVQNMEDTPASISSYSMDFWDNQQRSWVPFIHLSLGEGYLYQTLATRRIPCGSPMNGMITFPRGKYRFGDSAELDPFDARPIGPVDKLEDQLGHMIGAHETVYGWEALDVIDHNQLAAERMRIHLNGSAGEGITVEVPTQPLEGQEVTDVHQGKMIPTSECTDLSKRIMRSGRPLIP